MNLSRIFANALARRLAAVLVGVVLAWLGIREARAQQGITREQAYTACQAYLSSDTVYGGKYKRCRAGSGGYLYERKYDDFSSWSVSKTFPWDSECQAGYVFNEESGRCQTECSSRPNLRNVSHQGGTFCSGGCAYEADDVAPENSNSINFNFGGSNGIVKHVKRMRPTGGMCSSLPDPPEVQPDVCVQQGTLTQCATADGEHCAVSQSGKKFCWQPGENGTKTSGNEASTKSPVGLPVNIPPVPPKNGGEWQQTGQGSVSSTVNNITNNSTVNNWTSNYGSGGSGASGGGAKGEPNGGSGDGSGKGEGEGEQGNGDHGTVGGGGTCQGGFTCTGGDPVLCAIAQQQFLARCEAEKRGEGNAAPFPGNGDGGAGDDPDPKESSKSVKMGLDFIDIGGVLGGGSCPTFETAGTSFGDFSMNNEDWCRIIAIGRAALLMLGAFLALGILMGWGSNS